MFTNQNKNNSFMFRQEEKPNIVKWTLQNGVDAISKSTDSNTNKDRQKSSYTGTNIGMGDSTYAPQNTTRTQNTRQNRNTFEYDDEPQSSRSRQSSGTSSWRRNEEKEPDYNRFNFKIVGDDVTRKDYEDFYEGMSGASKREPMFWMNQTKNTIKNITNPNSQQKQIYRMPDALQKETRFPLQTDILKKSLTSPDDIWSLTNTSPRQFEQKYYYHPEDSNNSLYGFETIQALDDIRNSKALEYISYGLAGASLIPFIDTAADLISIPVDLLRGDYVSAGLDAVGAIPFFGEAADATKLAKLGFDAADTAKDVDNITDAVRITESADDIYDLTTASDKAYKAYGASEFAKLMAELSESPERLIKNGWEDVTDIRSVKNNPKLRHYKKGIFEIKFEKGVPGANGFKGIDHYHIRNPNSTGNHDYYLDELGNPVPRKSKRSHIVIK